MKTYVSAKIHGARVTDRSVGYHGSMGIGRSLMDAAGIEEFEQVHVVNLRNGNRWVTYAIAHPDEGAISLNGGAALLGEMGDSVIILSYVTTDTYSPARVIFCDEHNQIVDRRDYIQQPVEELAIP
jgi:aspartate 1-decarboxylase